MIVNHVSSEAPQFRDWREHGSLSPHAGMFLTFGRVFPDGATEADLLCIYRPRPGLPFTPFTVWPGERHLVWTTFTSRQADLDVRHPEARRYLFEVLERLAASGVALVRLDAVGYAVKTPGTSSFMTLETFAFISELTRRAHGLELEVLVEVHSHHSRQVEIGRQVDWVYDFALPPLILHGLFAGDAGPLTRWLDMRPHNAVTVLDTHDGIGVIDVGADQLDPRLGGLLEPEQVHALVERIHEASGHTSRRATGDAASNVDLYQVNCTYFDALGGDDRRYLLARLLQFFVPGVPQVYYVGLLAGSNDMELLERTGVGRDVNRHSYDAEELSVALERPVVRALIGLIRLRSSHPAFGGEWERIEASAGWVKMIWRAGEHSARLAVNLPEASFDLRFTSPEGERAVTEVAELLG